MLIVAGNEYEAYWLDKGAGPGSAYTTGCIVEAHGGRFTAWRRGAGQNSSHFKKVICSPDAFSANESSVTAVPDRGSAQLNLASIAIARSGLQDSRAVARCYGAGR